MKQLRKRILSIVLTLCMVAGMLPVMVLPAAAIGQYGVDLNNSAYSASKNKYARPQCTWYCWGRAMEKCGVDLTFGGNAQEWYNNATRAGFSVGTNPRANSIAVFRGTGTQTAAYGHVLFVEKIVGTTAFYTEGNYLWTEYHEGAFDTTAGVLEPGSAAWEQRLIGYIYLEPCDHAYQTVSTGFGHCNAKCSKCGEIYDYNKTFSTADAGYYAILKDYIRIDPYQDAKDAPVNVAGLKVDSLNRPVVTVSGSVTNAYNNKWYKTESGYYIYWENVTKTTAPPPASTLSISGIKSPISITFGDSFSLTGAVTSNYTISSVTAAIDGQTFATYNPKNSSFTLQNVSISSSTSKKLLPQGSHTLVITANDGKKTVSKTIDITAKAPQLQPCAKPSITYSDIPGGKRVTITQNTPGATLYYYYYGTGGQNASSQNTSITFDINQYAEVTAYSEKIGMKRSDQAYLSINVPQLSAPTFEVSATGEGAKVFIKSTESAKLRYSLDGWNYQDYTGAPVEMSGSGTVRAYAVRSGYRDSDVAQRQVELTAPAAPAVSLTPAGRKMAVNSALMANWKKIGNALSYTVKFYKNGTLAETKNNVTETNATFILTEAADYYFTVSAHNKFGDSAESTSPVVSAIAPLRVRFVDHDGAVLSEQTVDYGAAATEPPEPERKGHYFQRWNKSFSSVTEDMEISPEYKIITYSVTYLDADGRRIRTEYVDYGNPANPPVNELVPPSQSYEFIGWSIRAESADSACNLDFIDSNITAQAVFRWKNAELPVTVNSVNATWSGGNYYTVTVDLEAMPLTAVAAEPSLFANAPFDAALFEDEDTFPDITPFGDEEALLDAVPFEDENAIPDVTSSEDEDALPDATPSEDEGILLDATLFETSAASEKVTTALLRVSLKTAEGKMVKTESRTVQLSSAGKATVDISLNYSGVATVVEAVVLGYDGDYLTGSTYSEAKSATVRVMGSYAFGNWSDWSETPPGSAAGYERQIETKTQYRYRTKSRTTSTNSTLDGWTREGNPVQNYGAWGGESAWTRTQPTASDTLQIVQTRTVTDRDAYTQYNYYHWWGVGSDGQTYNSYGNAYWKNYESVTSTTAFPYYQTFDSYYPAYKQSMFGKHGPFWWLESTTTIPAATHTEWTYKTRSTYYTYQFYQWGAWSDWQDTAISQTADMQVETMVVYRYRDQNIPVYNEMADLAGSEDKSGEVYALSGTLPVSVDVSGKKATVMVYKGKNSDPNESQLQYVGQIEIGGGNSYQVQFKTREAPSTDSGDYMVAMSLEGSTGLITTDIIKAPVPEYTVNFVSDIDNSLIYVAEDVPEGSNVKMPAPPQVEGYRFVCWSDSGTNIHGDPNIGEISIIAHYIPNTYAVAFVDYVQDQVMLFTAPYGASLQELASQIDAPSAEGYDFDRWDYAADAVITDNVVINAVYTPKEYTVNFYRNDDTILISQQVPYNDSAQLPEGPAVDGMTFLGWSTDTAWWNVKEDVNVYPLYVYNETAMKPESDVEISYSGANASFTLTAEPGAKIYYTLDGSEPDVNSQEYTGPITLTEDAVIRAIAILPQKNESEVLEVYFTRPEEDGYNVELPDIVEVGTYNIVAEPGSSTTIQVKTNADLGLVGYLFTVECDKSVFYVDYNEESGFETAPGDASKAGMIFCSPYGDSGWQVLWFSDSDATGAGDLFTLTLRVPDDAKAGTYPVKVSYSPANTVTKEDVEATQDSIGILLGGGNSLLGDVNGDGYITTVDVVRIARYIIDDFTLTKKQLALADVTGDKDVTASDVIRLARYIIGLAELG